MSGGQFSGTLAVHSTAHRSATFVAGEVWSYTRILEFFKKASATSGDSDGRVARRRSVVQVVGPARDGQRPGEWHVHAAVSTHVA